MHSAETKRKIGLANRKRVTVLCDDCGEKIEAKPSKVARVKRNFCNQACYSSFRKTKMEFTEHNSYRGIAKRKGDKYIYHRRYVKSHPERIAHLKARRYARERNAEGSHTLEEWQDLCDKFNGKCAYCNERKKLTKDHIIPLSANGTDWIKNIQPLCRNCNSRKWRKLTYENPELIEKDV